MGKGKHKYEDYKRMSMGKIDTKVSKKTLFDDIIKKNTSKLYPLPGPGSHFLDEKLITQWQSKNKDLFKMPTKQLTKENTMSRQKRHFGDLDKAWILGPDYNNKVSLIIIFNLQK